MRLLILGDLHFFRTRLTPGEWLSKRILGQTNLLLNRRHHFAHGLFPAMLARALAQKPDAVVLTGDLTTTALEREFADARAALAPVFDAQVPVLAVPGNHDRYTFAAVRRKLWEAACGASAFPVLKPLGGRWRALLLDSAAARVFSSRGCLGQAQLDAAQKLLQGIPAGDGVVVVCHYPLFAPAGLKISWNRDMAGREELTQMLKDCQAKVVYVHGHIHQPWHLTPEKEGVPFDCINAGAPCQIHDKSGKSWPGGQGFWTLDLPEDPAQQVVAIHHAG